MTQYEFIDYVCDWQDFQSTVGYIGSKVFGESKIVCGFSAERIGLCP